jgi:hypothetical protein
MGHPAAKWLLLLYLLSHMQGIYNHIPETNHISRVKSFAAVLYFHISTLRSMRAVPIVAVVCTSLTSCFPGLILRYFLNASEMVPVAPIIIGYYYYYYYTVTHFPLLLEIVLCYTRFSRCLGVQRPSTPVRKLVPSIKQISSSYNTNFTVTDLRVWYGVAETALDLYFDIICVVFYFVYLCFLCPLLCLYILLRYWPSVCRRNTLINKNLI